MRKILFISILSIALSGCDESEETTASGSVALRILPRVENSATSDTRAIVTGTTFANGSSVGLALYNTSTSDPHRAGYDAIQATTDGTNWTYSVNGVSSGNLLGFQDKTVDIYGYYPYNELVTDVTTIPFTIAHTEDAIIDYMWASRLGVSTTGGEITLPFNHLMTCLEFKILKLYAGPALTVKSIEFSISGREFTTGGTYNARDASIKANVEEAGFVVFYNKTLANKDSEPDYDVDFITCSILMPKLEYTSGEATLSATINFDNESLNQGGTYTFKLSDVDDGSGNQGLLAGKRYSVSVKISNFVNYSGVPIYVDTWEDAVLTEEESDHDITIE